MPIKKWQIFESPFFGRFLLMYCIFKEQHFSFIISLKSKFDSGKLNSFTMSSPRYNDHSSDLDDPEEHDLAFINSNNNSFSEDTSGQKRTYSQMEPDIQLVVDEDSLVNIPGENDNNVLQNVNEKVFVGPEKIPANGRSSYVWKYMGFLKEDGKIVDRSYVYCFICKAKLKYCKSTSSLLAHLKKHPEVSENNILIQENTVCFLVNVKN